jgi:Transposase, Mutator family
VLASAHEQSVPIFQQLARGHPSGRDDVRAIPTVASETSKISWPSAGSTSATRPFGSGGTGLARCLPPRFVSLRGLSAGDFQEALTALFGKDAPNVSPAVIARLKGEWEGEYRRWLQRDLSARRYVYVWADGVYLQARMEPQAECMLVLIGHARGQKGTGRLPDGPARERAELEGIACRDEGARAGNCAGSRRRRRR